MPAAHIQYALSHTNSRSTTIQAHPKITVAVVVTTRSSELHISSRDSPWQVHMDAQRVSFGHAFNADDVFGVNGA